MDISKLSIRINSRIRKVIVDDNKIAFTLSYKDTYYRFFFADYHLISSIKPFLNVSELINDVHNPQPEEINYLKVLYGDDLVSVYLEAINKVKNEYGELLC